MSAQGERVSWSEGPSRRCVLLLHEAGHEELGTRAEAVLGQVERITYTNNLSFRMLTLHNININRQRDESGNVR